MFKLDTLWIRDLYRETDFFLVTLKFLVYSILSKIRNVDELGTRQKDLERKDGTSFVLKLNKCP